MLYDLNYKSKFLYVKQLCLKICCSFHLAMTVAAVTQAGVCDLHISQENYFSHGVTTDMKMVRRQILPYRLYMIRKRDVWHGCYSFFPFEVISCELLSSGKGGEGMNMKHFREFWQINIIILFFYFFLKFSAYIHCCFG